MAPCHLRLDQQASRVRGHGDLLPTLQTAIPPRGLVEALRKGEGVRLPGEQSQPAADRVDEHLGPGQPGQVEIPGKVVHELADGGVLPAPERHVVQVLAQDR